ncbi:MAG TPA: hypothetical protein VLL52_10080 [Anaerolineae bacterium]|nr:hypothetical protein [Anaerolineae bacterium]
MHNKIGKLPRSIIYTVWFMLIIPVILIGYQAQAHPAPNNLSWSTPMYVSTNANNGAFIPNLVIDSTGHHSIIYTQRVGSISNPYIATSGNGTSWSTPAAVYQSDTNSYEAKAVIDNNDIIHAIWRVEGASLDQIYYSNSTRWDAGDPPVMIRFTFGENNKLASPNIAVDPEDGTVHAAWVIVENSVGKVEHSLSFNNGANWQAPTVPANSADQSAVDVTIAITINELQQHIVHIAWQENILNLETSTLARKVIYQQGRVNGTNIDWNGLSHVFFEDDPNPYIKPQLLADGADLHIGFTRRNSLSEQYAFYSFLGDGLIWDTPTQINPTALAVNDLDPNALSTSLIRCDGALHMAYHGMEPASINQTERIWVTQKSESGSWALSSAATATDARYINPSFACYDDSLYMAVERIVSTELQNHQIYYIAGSGNITYMPSIFNK